MKRVLVVSSRRDIDRWVRDFVRTGALPDYEYFYVTEHFASQIPATPPNTLAVKDFSRAEEVARILTWTRSLGLDLVASADEFAVYIAGLVRDACGLEGLSAEACRRYRDKRIMVDMARAGGVRVPATFDPHQVPGDLTFPLIVKPRALAGAVGVRVVNDWPEWTRLSAGFSRSAGYMDMSLDQVLVQERIEAPIHHVDFVVRDGRLAWGVASAYTGTPLQYLAGASLISTIQSGPDLAPVWKRFVLKVLRALRLDDGVYHLEAFHAAGEEPIFLEIGFRPGGAMVVPLIRALLDVDLLAVHLALQLKYSAVSVPRSRGDKTGAWVVVPKHHGSNRPLWVEEVLWPRTAFASEVIHFQTPKPGDAAAGEFFCHEDSLGSFAFVGEAWQIDRDIRTVCEEYRVKTKSEEVWPCPV